MPDLFISYARTDSREFVARLSAALEERGKDAWVDLEDIPAASVWNEDLRAGIASSDSFCFVISPTAVTSQHCRAELEYAVDMGKRLLPVLHLPVPDGEVPDEVGSRNWIPQTGRFTDDFGSALDTLILAIETDLDWVREHTRWGLRAEEWVRRGEDRSVLARGSDLDQAEAFLGGGGGHEPQPTELQGRYILASRRAASRRQRQLVTGVSVALVLTLVLAVLALLQRNTAVEQRREAERQRASATSRALAANAFLNLPTDPELSLLLGLEAAKASPTVEAENALRSGLLASQVRGQLHHDGAVNAASYSPDGSTILTISEDLTSGLWDAESGERIAVLEGHTATPQQAAWSADGSRVVTIAQDSTAVVYDGRTGEQLATITDPDDYRLTNVLISSDGSVVVTSGFVLQQVRFWNASDGSLLGTIPRTSVDAMALSPDQTLLLTAQQGEAVELWSTDDLSLVASYSEDTQSYFTTAAFSADGSEFLTAGGDGSATVRARDGTFLAYVQSDGAINDAVLSPDGQRVATAGEDGTAVVTSIAEGEESARYAAHSGPVATIAFAPAGDLVATGGEDGTVHLWRPDSGAEVAALVGHKAPVNTVVFDSAADRVLSASDDSTARMWSTAGASADFPQESANAVPDSFDQAVSANGQVALMAVTDDDSGSTTARTVDTSTGEVRSQFVLREETLVPALSDDGGMTLTTTPDGSAVRRTSDGSVLSDVPLGEAESAAFDREGGRVVVVGAQGRAAVFDARSGDLVTELEGHDASWEVVAAAFSADDERIATASLDGTVRVWGAETGEQQLELDSFGPPPSHSTPAGTVAFSPDGRYVVNALGYETDARLWDAHNGKPLATLEGGKGGGVVDLDFSDDGRFLVTANFSGPVRLWDGRSGRPLAPVTAPDQPAVALGFTSGTTRIALVMGQFGEGSLAVLDCDVCGDLDSLVSLAKTRVTRPLTDTEKATYLRDE